MSLDKETREQLVKALQIGMPKGNAADLVKISRFELEQEMDDDSTFAVMVNEAIAQCMNERLKKLDKLENWQALAFILQSLWPEGFGRTSRGRRRRRKKNRPQSGGELDFAHLSEAEDEQLKYLLAKAHGRNRQNRSDEHVQIGDGTQPLLLHSTSLARR
jgi:hypothetical protein